MNPHKNPRSRPRPNLASCCAPDSRAAGFSLLEVLMALVICAILSLGILAAQYQSFKLADGSRSVWSILNFSEEFLARRYPAQLKEPTPGKVDWTDTKVDDAAWQLDIAQPQDGVRWMSLSTFIKTNSLHWEWPARAPGEIVGNWPGKEDVAAKLQAQAISGAAGGAAGQSGAKTSGTGSRGSSFSPGGTSSSFGKTGGK